MLSYGSIGGVILISMSKIARSRQYGFTIVELLIVIVVIGILAAITIVAYNGIQNRANDGAVRSDLANAAKKFEIYKIDYGTYPQTATDLLNVGASASKSAYLLSPSTTYNFVPCVTAAGADYSLGAISKSGNRFYIGSKSGGIVQVTSANDWTGVSGYTYFCSDSLAGSALPTGGGAPGYGNSWRSWVSG